MERMRILLKVAATVTLLAGAASSGAQQTHDISLRLEAQPGTALAGALVALVDSSNRVVNEVLSNSSGRVALRAAAGTYRVRVRRIGYRPFYTAAIDVPLRDELLISVESPRVVLASMVVNVRAHCGSIKRDAEALSAAWEEISKALKASQLTATDLSEIGQAIVFHRDLRADGSIISADSVIRPSARGRPFGAISPASLVQQGYVRGNARDGWEYFGPDETVLLSSGFAETHCFRIVRDNRRKGDLGVAFEPAAKRRISDIAGVLWIDEQTSELREVTFKFVNVEFIDRVENGGHTRFRRMPSGAWIVEDWLLRVPKIELRGFRLNEVVAIGFIEDGGRLIGGGNR